LFNLYVIEGSGHFHPPLSLMLDLGSIDEDTCGPL
jgi:hypothetical protein